METVEHRQLERLRSSRAIRAVIGARRSAATSTVVVYARRGSDPGSRVAVVAGRKVGSAVLRNRAKRRLREALRRVVPHEAMDIVVIARPDAVTAPFEQLREDVRSGMDRAVARAGIR